MGRREGERGGGGGVEGNKTKMLKKNRENLHYVEKESREKELENFILQGQKPV